MNEPVLYTVLGAAGYALLRRVYRRLFDGTAGHVDALAAENRQLKSQNTILSVENQELRARISQIDGIEIAEPPYMARVREFITERQMIAAIKEYRVATGVDLRTAKEYVEALANSGRSVTSPTATVSSIDRITDLVIAGNKIAAIRDYRQATGASLAEAKQHVESIERELTK